MAYNQKNLDAYRHALLSPSPTSDTAPYPSHYVPYRCATCPYCTRQRDPVYKHLHASTKPKDPFDFYRHTLVRKYRHTQAPMARANLDRVYPSSSSSPSSLKQKDSSAYANTEKLLVCGPMVDQSELPFRLLCRYYGAGLVYTPMLHAALFAKDAHYRQQFLQETPLDLVRQRQRRHTQEHKKKGEEEQEEKACVIDRPVIVQFCANDADTLLTAAQLAVHGGETMDSTEEEEEGGERYYHCDAVDLNLGCPQGIARRGHYGSFLMDASWDLLHRLVHTLAVELAVPVTAKIRVFDYPISTQRHKELLEENRQNKTMHMNNKGKHYLYTFQGQSYAYDVPLTIAYARMLRDAGAALLCVHGRARQQKGQLSGLAELEIINLIRDAFEEDERQYQTFLHEQQQRQGDGKEEQLTSYTHKNIPIISNGNILSFADIAKLFDPSSSFSSADGKNESSHEEEESKDDNNDDDVLPFLRVEGHMCAEPLLWDPTLFSNPSVVIPSGRLPPPPPPPLSITATEDGTTQQAFEEEKAIRLKSFQTTFDYLYYVKLSNAQHYEYTYKPKLKTIQIEPTKVGDNEEDASAAPVTFTSKKEKNNFYGISLGFVKAHLFKILFHNCVLFPGLRDFLAEFNSKEEKEAESEDTMPSDTNTNSESNKNSIEYCQQQIDTLTQELEAFYKMEQDLTLEAYRQLKQEQEKSKKKKKHQEDEGNEGDGFDILDGEGGIGLGMF